MPGRSSIQTGFLQYFAFSIIIFQLLYGGKSVPKAQTRDLKEMILNRDIERIVVINKEVAEIYLKKEAIESGRYPNLNRNGNRGMGLGVPKPNYTYNIADISTFQPFILKSE
jgi:cell division protease FtsH